MENALTLPKDGTGYDAKLAEMMGQRQKKSDYSDDLPKLKVNKQFEDDDGNTIPPASFHVVQVNKDEDGNETKLNFYAKEATLRVFLNCFQVRQYDPDGNEGKGKHINQTLKITNYQQEMRDELGGLRCGKIKSKERDQYSEEEVKLDAKFKKTYRILYGTVTFENAVNEKGDKVELTNCPVQVHLRGTNYMPFGDILDAVEDADKMIWNFPLKLSLEKKKRGDTIWYIIGYNLDFNNHVVATEEDGTLLVKFLDTVKFDNDAVDAKFNAAMQKKSNGDGAADIMNELEGDTLENDMNDGIPF